ncbi:hypothetical protein D1872_130190 [compost metagenome]
MANKLDYLMPSDDPGKKEKDSKKKKDTPKVVVVEGTLEVMPDCRYQSGQRLQIFGAGAVFNGIYTAKRVLHRIGRDGYTVQITVEQNVTGASSKSGGSTKSSADKKSAPSKKNAPAKDKAPTKSASSGKTVKVNKATGEVTR